MAINATCGRCLQRVKVDARFAGRKALCPVCDGAVPIPKEGEAGQAVSPVDFVSVIDHFKISDWDKAYCMAAAKGGVSEAAVRKCVIGVRRRVKSGLEAVPVGELLVTEGVLSSAQHKKLIHAVSKKDKVGEKVTQCPNCFEEIPASSDKCRYCGEILGDLSVMDMCPNCKAQQSAGGRFCQECGADMESGLITGVSKRRCPRCGVLSSSMVAICPVCQTPFDRSAAAASAGVAATKLARVFKDNMGYLILLGLILLGMWAYKNQDRLLGRVRSELHGERETKIEDAVDDWIKAVRYRDVDTMNTLVSGAKITEKDIPRILGHPGVEIKEILEVNRTDIRLVGDRASVYVDTKIRIPQKGADGAASNIEALGNILQKDGASKTVLKANTTWHWVLKDDRWLFQK